MLQDDAVPQPGWLGRLLGTALWQSGWQVLDDPRSVVVHDRFGSTARPFREFVYLRNRVRYLEKWSSVVAGRPHYPPTAEVVAAAAERVAGWMTIPPATRPVSGRQPPEEAPPIVYIRRERDLLRDYAAHLESLIDESESRRAELAGELAALDARYRRLRDHPLVRTALAARARARHSLRWLARR